jgi:AcrR family transcriptional regulator
MARRSDHTKDELKGLILKTSIDIVKNEGFKKLTARRLAKDIGYTPGTIYNVYESMDGLYFAIKACTLKKLLEAINITSTKSKITDNMKDMAKSYMNFAHTNRELWLMVFSQSSSHDETTPDYYKELVTEQFAPLEKMLEPLIQNNQSKDKAKAARALWATVHGICLMKETNKLSLLNNSDAFQIIEYMIDKFVAGIENTKP